MKLGWRLATESNSLWSRVMRAKYGTTRSSIAGNNRNRGGSNAWKGIMETLEMTKKGVGHTIGDGRQTKFWKHRWIDGRILADQTTQELPEDQKNRLVREYWDHDTGWKWDLLSQYLPRELLQRVASFELAREGVEDNLLWVANKSGKFSIKSALTLVSNNEQAPTSNWKWVWRTRVPQRIQMFTWLLMHNKVLTNAMRCSRNLSTDPACARCEAQYEDIDHVLRGCLLYTSPSPRD